MEIKILGMGCPRCDEVMKRTMNALVELNVAADVQKVKDIKEISSYGVLSTPGLVIDNTVKSQGRIPSVVEIKEWIQEETK
jgi:small redox-active disulfide protein 2